MELMTELPLSPLDHFVESMALDDAELTVLLGLVDAKLAAAGPDERRVLQPIRAAIVAELRTR